MSHQYPQTTAKVAHPLAPPWSRVVGNLEAPEMHAAAKSKSGNIGRSLSLSLPGSSMLNICSGKRKANECMYQHCKLAENEGGRNCCARLDRRLAQENGGVEKKNSHTPRLPPPAFEYTLPAPRLIKPQPAGVARDARIDTTQPTLNPTASH